MPTPAAVWRTCTLKTIPIPRKTLDPQSERPGEQSSGKAADVRPSAFDKDLTLSVQVM